MKIGIVGYQGSGKSTLFTWLTGVPADPALGHASQSAMATVPDKRLGPLCEIYKPKKVTEAAIELVDTPGLDRKHEGNAAKLGLIREAGCLIQVVAAYDEGVDPMADLEGFQEDFLLADLEIVSGRVQRLRESIKKARFNREQQEHELAAIEPVLAQLESGKSMADFELSDEQEKATRSFSLLTLKPRLAIFNLADDDTDGARFEEKSTDTCPIFAVPVGLEMELERMEPEERDEFRREMGAASYDRDGLIRTIMDASGQHLFFTAGDKEVRTWMIHKGATAVEAADSIHSDLARGFIRAETMTCADLLRLGSEREIKANHLMRQEPKDYVLQDGDIINVKFSV